MINADLNDNTKYTAGEIVVVTQGDCSDYCIVDVIKVLKDFDNTEYIKNHKAVKIADWASVKSGTAWHILERRNVPTQPYKYRHQGLGSMDKHLSELIKDGCIESIRYREAHEINSVCEREDL